MEIKFNIKNHVVSMPNNILSGQSKRSFGLLNSHSGIKFDKLIIKLPDDRKLCKNTRSI